MTMQEWVSALPEDSTKEEKLVGEEAPVEENDNRTLGAEGMNNIHFL